MVKNPPCNSGDADSIPGEGAKIPHAEEQLSLHTTATEAHARQSAHVTTIELGCHNDWAYAPQLESPHHNKRFHLKIFYGEDLVCHN